ncbi:MAG: hypothetical protein D5S00_07220 [Tindallia sp. MSAO_Bac2]|nr:MAG: hypothetical protein D5S00_07220 [Tindallia sp. MSAO_Bac2]
MYDKFYEARSLILKIIREDFLGPLNENEIICDERPLDYYILGKLYPQKSASDIVAASTSDDYCEIDADADNTISLCNGNNPSSIGISFTLKKGVKAIRIKVDASQYEEITYEEANESLKFEEKEKSFKRNANFWRRKPLSHDSVYEIKDIKSGKKRNYEIFSFLELCIYLHKVYDDGSKTFTVSIVNKNICSDSYKEQNAQAFFQPRIAVSSVGKESIFTDVRRNINIKEEDELLELEMLYSHINSYASGHGCAVKWDMEQDSGVHSVRTEFLPESDVFQMKPMTDFKSPILSMKYLAESKKEDIVKELNIFLNLYEAWIDKQNTMIPKLNSKYYNSALENIKKCRQSLSRIRESIKHLDEDLQSFKAFQLANKAMYMQRKQMLVNEGKYKNDESILWYPFQLAFILQETLSFIKPESNDRKLVDLLWFPTGGGKTEAYLGIAAFVIFLRRLRHGVKGDGVTVLMRYTLRLLSFQQFERAAALILACEIIRKEENIKGGTISIGLWAGRALTPNDIKTAAKILRGGKDEFSPSSNPAQIKKCPWCGQKMDLTCYSCDENNNKMNIKCPNNKCYFNDGLPLSVIDEEIFAHTPSFIIATVDKFAQIAIKQNTGVLFGNKVGKLPPELIIQDELHLISGPLGTITAIYEAAIKKLCEHEGVSAKIIASTATIRNAQAQIKALYAADYMQFPSQGININDSFFAKISSADERPARLYLGCMATGTSPTTMMIRVMSSLLFATRYLKEAGYEDKVVDSFWTLTGYFNTLRELGGALVRVIDDIQDRFIYLKKSKFAIRYPLSSGKERYDNTKELTSRESSENIGNVIQEELKVAYPSNDAFDFLLASNMISVGVDVGRLGTMVVVGQPKLNAEYIQATSRVGRESPGLVIATYNQAKSRDRSHYEQFTQYHSAYYRYVEATSLTPFSDRARDRALQALYVILCRHLIDLLTSNDGADNFSASIKGLENVEKYICDHVRLVDPDEYDNVVKEIKEIKEQWADLAGRGLKYYEYFKDDNYLFQPDYEEGSRFRILNTMRSVETKVKVYMEE